MYLCYAYLTQLPIQVVWILIEMITVMIENFTLITDIIKYLRFHFSS